MTEIKNATPVEEKTLYQKLSASVPEKYLFSYEEDGVKLTGYNAQYAINLLNEVVGLGRWFTIQTIRKEEQLGKGYLVVMDLTLTIKSDGLIPDIVITGHSAAYAKKIENAYKGAKTSAFKQACKYLGIGNELYIQNTIDEDIVYVKEEEQIKEEVAIPKEAVDLEKKIADAKTVEQLESLSAKVNSVEGKSVKQVLLKKYNARKIALSK